MSQIEGSAGGGLVPWALVGGLGTNEQIGATAFATYVLDRGFLAARRRASVDIDDRVEVSVARQRSMPTPSFPGSLSDRTSSASRCAWRAMRYSRRTNGWPQIAVGAQWKRTLDFDVVPSAVGATHGSDVDLYVAATKMYFAALAGRNVIIDATLRRTRADQFGLLGFGGDQSGYRLEPRFSAGVWLSDDVLLGARIPRQTKRLGAFKEGSAEDAFIAWAPIKNFTATAAWTDLGPHCRQIGAARLLYLALVGLLARIIA